MAIPTPHAGHRAAPPRRFRRMRALFDALRRPASAGRHAVDGHERRLRDWRSTKVRRWCGSAPRCSARAAPARSTHEPSGHSHEQTPHRLHRRRQHGAQPDRRPGRARPAPPRRSASPNPWPRCARRCVADFGVQRVRTRRGDAADGAGTWVLAVKPQVMREVCAELAPMAQAQRPLVVSIAAGITAAQLERWLGGDVAVVRAMPNTPALLGAGVTGLFANARVDGAAARAPTPLLSAVGPDRLDRRRGAHGRGHCGVRQRPGLRVPAGRSDAGGRR